jgi:uncharacterized protein (TIGR00369 family)
MDGKKAADSEVIMTELVLPQHTNALGSIFGGVVMSWIDIAAAIAAKRHSGRVCVTASIDELHFLRPIKQGDIVNIKAKLTAVHRTSCEVHVVISAENPVLREKFKTADAMMTFVAIDSQGRPTEIPPLLAETEQEKAEQEAAKTRKVQRETLRRNLMQKAK